MINQNRRNLRNSRGRDRQDPQLSVEYVSVEPDATTKQILTKSNDDYILEEFNKVSGQPPFEFLTYWDN